MHLGLGLFGGGGSEGERQRQRHTEAETEAERDQMTDQLCGAGLVNETHRQALVLSHLRKVMKLGPGG